MGLWSDGKKSETMSLEMNSTGTFKKVFVKKEHLVLIKEPGAEFITYVTPESGSAQNTVTAILAKLKQMNINLNDLICLGADGCLVNTGWRGGMLRLLEVELGWALQRSICLLHLIELPLRAVFEHLYGKSKSGNTLNGEIASDLEICHTFEIVSFKKIHVPRFPKIEASELSQDQAYLFNMAEAVMSGHISTKLAEHTPGKICLSRWLTLAGRILRLYVSEINPSPKLLILVNFVLKIYVPHWQSVKTKNSISFGSQHFLDLVKRTR